MAKQNYMYSKAHDGKIPVETVKRWSHEVKRKPHVKTAADPVSKPESISALQRLIPGLVLGAAGAGYGALQSPGKSRLRGAVVGGTAGAGAGLGLEAARTFIQSPHGAPMSDGGNTASLFGGAALGGLGGLKAGRELAEYLQLGNQRDDTEDDLSELDARRARSWLPGGLSDLLSTERHKKAAQFIDDMTKQANTLPYALGGAALGGLAGAYMTGDDEDGRPASMGRRLRNAAIGAGVGGLGGAGLSMFGGKAQASEPSHVLPAPAASNGVDTGAKLDIKPQAGLSMPPAMMPAPDLAPSALYPDKKVPALNQRSDAAVAAAVRQQNLALKQQNNRNHIHPRAAYPSVPTHAGGVSLSAVGDPADVLKPVNTPIKPPVLLNQLPQTQDDIRELLGLPQERRDNAVKAIPKPAERTWSDAWKQYWK